MNLILPQISVCLWIHLCLFSQTFSDEEVESFLCDTKIFFTIISLCEETETQKYEKLLSVINEFTSLPFQAAFLVVNCKLHNLCVIISFNYNTFFTILCCRWFWGESRKSDSRGGRVRERKKRPKTNGTGIFCSPHTI